MWFALEQSPTLIILPYHHLFSGVVVFAKSNVPLPICQGKVLSCDLVPLKKCLCGLADFSILCMLRLFEYTRLTVFVEDCSSDLILVPFLNQQPDWCYALADDSTWFGDEEWHFSPWETGGWAGGLPSNFSSVTACAEVPGCFDMQQKMQAVNRASGKSCLSLHSGFP